MRPRPRATLLFGSRPTIRTPRYQAETGLPGLAIYVGLILAILNATRMPAWAKMDPEFSLLRNTALTLRLSLIAFCGGAMFGSFAYNMELPLLAGLAETLRRVLESRKHQTQVVRIPQPRASSPLPLRPALR